MTTLHAPITLINYPDLISSATELERESSSRRGRLARIVIVATGGTIAGAADAPTETSRYRAGSLGIETLLDCMPMLANIAELESVQFSNINSKDMNAARWHALSTQINGLLSRDDVDGVVVTHGTDTLEETAYWLHLTLNSEKPVVLCAAMRPATALSADGPLNLFDAVTVAVDPAAHGRGVMVVFANRIHSAREVSKTSGYSIDAFESPDIGILGWVQDQRVCFERTPSRIHTVSSIFSAIDRLAPATLPTVEIALSYAGATRTAIDAWIAQRVDGIVVAGSGNGSIYEEVQDALARASSQGIAVVRASRARFARVEEDGAAPDTALGFIAAGTLNPFKARVLLMLALWQKVVTREALRQLFKLY